jgi:hypothetical protein
MDMIRLRRDIKVTPAIPPFDGNGYTKALITCGLRPSLTVTQVYHSDYGQFNRYALTAAISGLTFAVTKVGDNPL